METRSSEIDALLEQTRSPDPLVRLQAVVRLCPCHVKRTHEQVWNRLITMATDRHPKVRGAVHAGAAGGPNVGRDARRSGPEGAAQVPPDPRPLLKNGRAERLIRPRPCPAHLRRAVYRRVPKGLDDVLIIVCRGRGRPRGPAPAIRHARTASVESLTNAGSRRS